MSNIINYTPPATIKSFIRDHLPGELFYNWIVGPVGSGKTTGLFFKLVYMAKQQAPGPDGIRRTKAVIVRNTLPQLRDTTLASWGYWFRDGVAGTWRATENKFTLKFDDVECEVLFRPLDTADDVARVLSLEINFAILDEFVQIPREIVEALSARLGRFKLPDGTPPTNWGMWGSSNPSTEDNWWFDYLHNNLPENAKYFVQPSGLSEGAENLDNLPGGRAYYTNQAKGKSDVWIKQFIDAEWGYSVSGKPVVPTFKADLHLTNNPITYSPNLPLVIGMDPGLGGSALIFGQQDLHGRLLVLGELVQSGYGVERLITEKLRPYLRRRFPDAKVIIAPDPAANNRSQTNEKTVVDLFRKHFEVDRFMNNRLNHRLDPIEHFTTRLTDIGAALRIDAKECPILVRALKGGWRYAVDSKRDMPKPEPEKNAYSHPGDAFGYLCGYFYRQTEREMRYSTSSRKPFVPPRQSGAAYHFR